jgi:hypothetical protein
MRGSLCASALALAMALCGCTAEDKVLEADDSGVNSGDAGGNGASSGGLSDANGGNANGGNANGGSDGGANNGTTGGVASDPECDMNGIWIGRQITRSVALGAGQFANNYYYLELTQNGDEVVVSKHFDCGIVVRGTVTVQLSRATLEALMTRNLQQGRAGSLKKNGDRCDFAMERFWSVRGANEERFTPSPRNTTMSIAAVAAANPLPTKDNTDGAEDWENDGVLGVAWQVSLGNSVRNTVQRDWTEWFTDDEFTIEADAAWPNDLVVRSMFDVEEKLIAASSSLVSSLSTVDGQAKHTLTLRFLGRSLEEAKSKGILGATDFDTCTNIRNALPAKDGF